jgi:PKD repeat protein
VTFTDTSTGSPTSWAWSFGDGGTSTSRNPVHSYTAAGTYTVSLTATNGNGSTTATQTGFITVTGPSSVVTLNPVADAQVKSTSATTNYGSLNTLRLRLGNSSSPGDYRSFLRFDVSGLTGPVASAKLRLYVTEASSVGGQAFRADPGWVEGTLNWNNQPAMPGSVLSTVGSVAQNTWVEFDVTAAVTGNGVVNLGLRTTSQSSVIYSSREGANKPQLVITQS